MAEEHTGGMVAFVPTSEHAQQLVLPDGEPLEQLHVTIAYLGDDVTGWTPEQQTQVIDAARTVAADAPPVEGRAFAHTTFNPDGGPDGSRDSCAVYLIGDSDQLVPIRDAVIAALDGMDLPDQHTPYVPHLTAGYGKTAADLTYTGPVTLDRLLVALGGEHHIIPLAGTTPAEGGSNAMTVHKPGDGQPIQAYKSSTGSTVLHHVPADRPVTASGSVECFRVTAEDLEHGMCCMDCGNEFGPNDFYAERLTGENDRYQIYEVVCLGCFAAPVPAPTAPEAVAAPASYGQVRDLPDPEGWHHGTIPVVVVEGMATGDGRIIPAGSLSGHRALPIALMSLSKTSEGGHLDATVFGRIDHLERVPGPDVINIDTGEPFPEGTFVWRSNDVWVNPDHEDYGWARSGALSGISVDLSETEAELQFDEDGPEDGMLVLSAGRIAASTLCTIPAFPGAHLVLDDDVPQVAAPEGEMPLAASGSWRMETESLCASCTAPPAEWFTDPQLDGPQGITVTEDGRIYGHVTDWNTCHIGLPGCVKAPRSRSGYAYFHTGAVLTSDGATVPVGRITLGTGHANLSMGAAAATEHYDHTGTCVADVAAGEDQHGIWVAGALRPGVTDEQLRVLRASPLSGDWRPIAGGLEMVGALCVNVAGFPIPRPRAVLAAGVVTALVAAGAIPPKKEKPVTSPAPDTNPPAIDTGTAVEIADTGLQGVVTGGDDITATVEVQVPVELLQPVADTPADEPVMASARDLKVLRATRAEQILARIRK